MHDRELWRLTLASPRIVSKNATVAFFNNKKYEHSTNLSSYVRKLKNENVPYRICWDIAGRAAPFNPATNISRLCLLEKYLIMFSYPEPKLRVFLRYADTLEK